MKRNLFLFILVVPLVCMFFAACAVPIPGGVDLPEFIGRIFYCSLLGDNSNDGSEASPWRTPGYASRQLSPGDMLVIKAGEYILSTYPDDMLMPVAGTAASPVVITGEGTGATVLKGEANLYAAVVLNDCSYVSIQNLSITNNASSNFRDGIAGVDGSLNNILLKNLYIHHIDEMGINFKDILDSTVTNCQIEYCGFGAIGGPDGSIGWQNVLVSDSSLSYSGYYYQGMMDNPALPYDRPDGIGLEESDGPVSVIDCTVEHNRGDGVDLKLQNSLVASCMIANNYGDGLKLWGRGSSAVNCVIYGTGDGDIASPWCPVVIDQVDDAGADFVLKNLTVHDNPLRRSYSIYSQYNNSVPLELDIINCTFSDSYGVAYFGENVAVNIVNSNFYAPNRVEQIAYQGVEYDATDLLDCSFGTSIISVDPDFVNPVWGANDGDYRLNDDSPLIDEGTSVAAPTTDIVKVSRPQGDDVDIGAYERSKSVAGDGVVCSSYAELQAALEAAASGGNKNIVMTSGNYRMDDAFVVSTDGITIRGETGDPEDVVLDGGGIFLGNSHIFLVSGDDFTLEGLTLQGVGNHAVQVQGELGTSGFTMRNCIIRDTGEQMLKISYNASAPSQKSTNGLIENTLFEYTDDYGPQYYIGGVDGHNCVDWIVRGCTFRNIRSPEDEQAEHAIHFWSDSEGTIAERNLIINCDRGIGYGLGDRGHIGGIIRNNMIVHEESDDFADVGIGLENARNVQVYNNTLFFENDYPNAIEYRFPGTTGCTIINNLTNKNITLRDGASGDVHTNVTSAQALWFTDVAAGDLHLAYDIPTVLNSGAAIEGLSVDYDNQLRPMESVNEIGADEVNASSLPELPETPPVVTTEDEIFNRYHYVDGTNHPVASYQTQRTIPGDNGGLMTLAFRLNHYGTAKQNIPLVVQVHEWGGDFDRMEEVASYCPTEYAYVMLSFQFIPSMINESCWWYGTHWSGELHTWAMDAIVSIINETLNTALVGNLDPQITLDPDRVYLFGHSIGGTGAFQVALRNPELFAAVHAHSGFTFFTPGDDVFRPLFETEIVGTAAENVQIGTPSGNLNAREYTDLVYYLEHYYDNSVPLPFLSMTAGTADELIDPSYGADRLVNVMDDLKQGFFYHRHNGEHSEDCFMQLNWLFNFRKNQSYLVFTNRSGYGIAAGQTVGMGTWEGYVSGGINDLYEMGWDPSSITDIVSEYSVQLYGSGTADCTLRNLQNFLVTPATQYRYSVNNGAVNNVMSDEEGLLTIENCSGGDFLKVW